MNAYSCSILTILLVNGGLAQDICYLTDICFGYRATTFHGDILAYSYSYECVWNENNGWTKFAVYYNDTDCGYEIDGDDITFSNLSTAILCDSECTDYVLYKQWHIADDNTECIDYQNEDFETIIQPLGCQSTGGSSYEFICDENEVLYYFYGNVTDCNGDPIESYTISLKNGCDQVVTEWDQYPTYVEILYCPYNDDYSTTSVIENSSEEPTQDIVGNSNNGCCFDFLFTFGFYCIICSLLF